MQTSDTLQPLLRIHDDAVPRLLHEPCPETLYVRLTHRGAMAITQSLHAGLVEAWRLALVAQPCDAAQLPVAL